MQIGPKIDLVAAFADGRFGTLHCIAMRYAPPARKWELLAASAPSRWGVVLSQWRPTCQADRISSGRFRTMGVSRVPMAGSILSSYRLLRIPIFPMIREIRKLLLTMGVGCIRRAGASYFWDSPTVRLATRRFIGESEKPRNRFTILATPPRPLPLHKLSRGTAGPKYTSAYCSLLSTDGHRSMVSYEKCDVTHRPMGIRAA